MVLVNGDGVKSTWLGWVMDIRLHLGKGVYECDPLNMKRTPKPCDVSLRSYRYGKQNRHVLLLMLKCPSFVVFLVLDMQPFTLAVNAFASSMAKWKLCICLFRSCLIMLASWFSVPCIWNMYRNKIPCLRCLSARFMEWKKHVETISSLIVVKH